MGALMRPLGLACVLLAGLAFLARGQGDCSGHGHLVDGKCVCSSPLPVDASPGWVGDTCNVQVHHLFLNGQDVQETCAEGHVCNVVAPSEPVCFATSIAELSDSSFHLALLLTSNNVEAVVTLRGLLTNISAAGDPAGAGGSAPVPQAYPTSSAAFSFAVHTSGAARSASLQLSRRQLGYGTYTGMYVCAESTASTTIALRGATHSCPFSLQPDGSLRLCSGRGAADSCPRGTCTCPQPYAPPDNWVMTPGLGFEDCSATLQPLQPPAPASPAPPPAAAAVADQAPGAWAFFRLELPEAANVFELNIVAAATQVNNGSVALFLRYQQLPGQAAGQHDVTSELTAASLPATEAAGAAAGAGAASGPSWVRAGAARVAVRRTDAAFRTGTWFLGALNRGAGPVSYSLSAALYDCPNNCSGRGTCAAGTATCTCSQASMQAPDCATSAPNDLTLGQNLTAPPSGFLYDRLVLRNVRQQLRSAATSHLRITAAFSTAAGAAAEGGSGGLPAWVAARPLLLVASSAADPSSGGLWPPGGEEGAARMALSEPGVPQSLDVGTWMLSPEDDSLHLLVLNPLAAWAAAAAAPPAAAAAAPLQVGYWLAAAVAGECLGNCSGHGTCDTATGLCNCQPGFGGGDCSVDTSGGGGGGGGSNATCAPGSFRPRHVEAARGTCWEACAADGSGFEGGGCADFTCDGGGGGQTGQEGPLRRRGGAEECVADACVAGNYTLVDAEGAYVCTRRCSCPADGGACGLEEACLPGTVTCLGGRAWDQTLEKCLEAPCAEGSLRRAHELEGGAAFALCVCAAAGDPASCAFSQPLQAEGNTGAVVACAPGFERQGSTATTRLSDGSSLLTGGTCVPAPGPRHGGGGGGVSGGMVFFYCLLSIGLAAGLLVGGKYGLLWYEQYRYGRSVFSQGGYVAWPLFGSRGQAAGAADDW